MGKKPSSNESGTKLWVKVLCGIMGFMMVFGVLVMLFSTMHTHAVENDSVSLLPDQQISVGLYCNENAVQSYSLRADKGFQIGTASGKLSVSLEPTALTVAVDNNLYKAGNSLTTASGGIAAVGGYHIEISYFTFSDLGIDTDHDNPVFIRPGGSTGSTDGYQPANVWEYIALLGDDSTFQALDLPAFPCYITPAKCYIRVGSFFTKEEAQAVLSQLQRTMTVNASIAEPDPQTVTVMDSDYKILCEFTGKDQSYQITSQREGVLLDAAGRAFSGSFLLSSTADGRGINVVNRLSLEEYISILLPSEVSADWNGELLKSMAVLLRTELARKLGCHAAEGYDLCTEGHCHAYIGGAAVTDSIKEAVSATKGQILTYEGKPIYTPYAMTHGSGTASAKDAFGKEIAYLPAIYTPWDVQERWSVEFSPFDLYQMLSSAGYTEIEGNITQVKINSTAEGSDYVSSITFTDLFGASVTVEGSEQIRLLFSGKLPSASFAVGIAGETVTLPKRTVTAGTEYTESSEEIKLAGTYGSFVFLGSGQGCGVGFSILGAKTLADGGFGYRQILATYFPGAKLPE